LARAVHKLRMLSIIRIAPLPFMFVTLSSAYYLQMDRGLERLN